MSLDSFEFKRQIYNSEDINPANIETNPYSYLFDISDNDFEGRISSVQKDEIRGQNEVMNHFLNFLCDQNPPNPLKKEIYALLLKGKRLCSQISQKG